jgi:hypothetical protein
VQAISVSCRDWLLPKRLGSSSFAGEEEEEKEKREYTG